MIRRGAMIFGATLCFYAMQVQGFEGKTKQCSTAFRSNPSQLGRAQGLANAASPRREAVDV